MDTKMWVTPITIDIRSDGHYRVVTSAKEAAKVLSNEWPPVDSPLLRNALAQSSAALRGAVSPEVCRAAFLRAAREAGIPVIHS